MVGDMRNSATWSADVDHTGSPGSVAEADGYEGLLPADTPSAGELDRAERASFKRVTGLSTELSDVSEAEYRRLRMERVVLVGVWTDGDAVHAEASLNELSRLAGTAGSEVLEGFVQRRNRPDPGTFIGAGKVHELRDAVLATGADTVICDGELAPGQLRQLEEKLKVKVIDRTALILDIFAQHARSREGKAQVELAQLQYFLPRLRGWGDKMSRQAGGRAGGGNGGVGTRGPGETKLETDRRRVHKRMTKLRKELEEMRKVRETKRSRRNANAVPSVAVAGYTNAGKSSLLNALTGAGLLVEDELFATLDTTVRRAVTPDGYPYTLTDTVGFVRHLPHQLVEAFRSTLEEVTGADLLVHVVDGAEAEPGAQVAAVREVISGIAQEQGVRMPPELLVVNKIDAVDDTRVVELRQLLPEAMFVSAQGGSGIAEVREEIASRLPRPEVFVDALVPYHRGELVSRAYSEGSVIDEEHTPDGTRMRVKARPELANALREFARASS
ncbi:GTPase HflX [Salinifilum aidingensis]